MYSTLKYIDRCYQILKESEGWLGSRAISRILIAAQIEIYALRGHFL